MFNSKGKLVDTAVATNSTSNDLTLSLNNLSGLSNYYVEVNSPNGGVFDMGSYELSITNNLSSTVSDLLGGVVGLLGDVGHTLLTALNLAPISTTQDNYAARADLATASQVDVYAVKAPPASSSSPGAMIATLWSLGNANLTPRLQVFDTLGDSVPFQVLTNNSGSSIIQVTNPTAGETYLLKVYSAAKQTGAYSMSVEFPTTAISFPHGGSGTLSSSAPTASAILTVSQSQVMHFVLAAGSVPAAPSTTVTLTITDSNGNVVAQLQVIAGDAESIDLFLQAGSYTLTVTAVSGSGGEPQDNIGFNLDLIGMTDPVAVQSQNPSSTPSGSSSSNTPTSSNSGASLSSTTPSSNSTWN